jgi:hypothetical protein
MPLHPQGYSLSEYSKVVKELPALTGCTLTTCRGRFSMALSLFDKMSNASNNFGVDEVVSAKHS